MSVTSSQRALLVERMSVGAVLLSLVVMAAAIATSPARRVYDERWHLQYAEQIAHSGWIATMTAATSKHGSAVGPVYPALHIGASPVTGFNPPAVRWINYLCLLVVIIALARSVPEVEPRHALTAAAASLVAVPFLWPTVGMALTELPALVPFTLFILVMMRVLRIEEQRPERAEYGLAIAAGVLFGLSVLSRQTYLVVVPAIAAVCLVAPLKCRFVVTVLSVSALVCGWIFVVWGGVIPPYAHRYDTRLDLRRIVLALGYVATATLFINPAWLRPRALRPLILPVSGATALAVLLPGDPFLPGRTLIGRLGELALPFAVVVRIVMTLLGFLWLSVAFTRAWESRRDAVRVFLFLALFGLIVGPAKGFEFSSRYLVGALGVLVLVVGRPPLDRWLPLRVLVGATAGALSLLKYYASR